MMPRAGGGGFFLTLVGVSTELARDNTGISVVKNFLGTFLVLPLRLVPDTTAGAVLLAVGVEGTERLELGVELMVLQV
jgi:hypothetical protein